MVARLDIALIPAGPAVYVIPPAPLVPAEAMIARAHQSLQAVGTGRGARFFVPTAPLERHPSDAGGLLSKRMEILDCTMRCTLDVLAPDGALRGNAKTEAQFAATVPVSTPAEQLDTAARFVRIAVARLNTAFDESIRRNLGNYLADGRSVGLSLFAARDRRHAHSPAATTRGEFTATVP